MTLVFYLYYFIDSWAGVVPIRHVSALSVSSRFPIVSISASGSYFEKRRCKGQILACCCWLIQPCGKWPRSAQMEPLGLNHSLSTKKKEVSTTLGGFPVLCCTACEIKTTQHPTTVNFKKKEIHWLWLLRGHFKVEAWAMAWSMARGLRTRRAESGISHCYGVKRFGPFDGSSMQPKIPGSNKKQSLKRWKEASSNESVWIITVDNLGSVFQLWEYFCTKLELCTNAGMISLGAAWKPLSRLAFSFWRYTHSYASPADYCMMMKCWSTVSEVMSWPPAVLLRGDGSCLDPSCTWLPFNSTLFLQRLLQSELSQGASVCSM